MSRKFINDLKNSSYYDIIFNNHDVMMIYIGGSRMIGCIDERSDYDLVVVISDKDDNKTPDEFLMYNGVKVHWDYRRISEFIEPMNRNTMGQFNGIVFNKICSEVIIYENPKYTKIIDYLKRVRDIIAKISTYNLYTNQKSLVESILTSGSVNEKHHTKFLYCLGYASYYIMGETPNLEFLNSIKRIRWKPVSDEYKKLLVERLGYLGAFVNQNTFDVSGMTKYINANLSYLVSSIV